MRIARAQTASGDRLVVQQDGQYQLLGDAGSTTCDLFETHKLQVGENVAAENPRFPLVPGKIVAIGLNYRDHIREADMEPPAQPLIFAKFPSTIISDKEPIVVDATLTQRVDWEVELAVVIGTTARNVAPTRALDHVFGYTVANDVSARDIQFADGQWIRGKNLDTFCPLGSVIVTADEIDNPQSLTLGTRVNGEAVQSSSTDLMLFSVAELISFCSRNFTLEPGDVLLTGTPWGCGEFMTPRRSLQPGDQVEVWVSEIGSLTNPVVAADSRSAETMSLEFNHAV